MNGKASITIFTTHSYSFYLISESLLREIADKCIICYFCKRQKIRRAAFVKHWLTFTPTTRRTY
jgi:hypothetical protein